MKIIRVHGRTSLQSHKNRTEYHIGVRCLRHREEHGYLPQNLHQDGVEYHFGIRRVRPLEKHRMNQGIYLELAFGEPREDDITRYHDDYGRG